MTDEKEQEVERSERPSKEAYGSKQIRISLEVYEAIRKRAKPLVDTPDTVLREVLGLPKRN